MRLASDKVLHFFRRIEIPGDIAVMTKNIKLENKEILKKNDVHEEDKLFLVGGRAEEL